MDAIEIKGWCPGALRPMPSGDGLIVRVRPLFGRLGVDDLSALGEAAARFGNGQLDLTRRANLQIRGVSRAALAPLQQGIRRMGLLDSDADGESVRNVMINPTAGIDPSEVLDVREVAAALTRTLMARASLWSLPGKFGFIVDGGGALDLSGERADIRLAAVRVDAAPMLAVGLDRRGGTLWLGTVTPDSAADACIAIATAYLDVTQPTQRRRMRELSETDVAAIRSVVAARLGPRPDRPPVPAPIAPRRVGAFDFGNGRFAVGLAMPFGHIEHNQIRTLVAALTSAGVSEVRLSPWRVLYAQVPDAPSARRLLDSAAGWIVAADDPLLRIEACPGAPSCASTTLNTRAIARQLAPHLPGGFTGNIHVSGCAKGCARSAPSDLVLVGTGDRFGIVRNGTARDPFSESVSASELAAFLDRIFRSMATA
ncbi:precorrin-3B synthase [Rhodopseudomonas sp. P2A-2r]|uniref:precorrin-3B synthase n=1 Tax=Rhodopseudomonas sp. P2A-2r TaxID=2991972 RepID=UPI00223497D1|nr:precorrin-3B synthase [Rhodopseudomonas sp. P2A-2r]UZE47533.1 precorrin-3B synthase [Rhodopseudomonas sp. P2A-2r]